MFYDLNVPWTPSSAELKQRVSFLAERRLLHPAYLDFTDSVIFKLNTMPLLYPTMFLVTVEKTLYIDTPNSA